MRDEQLDQAHALTQTLWNKVHDLVDNELSTVDSEVEDLVRTKMTEEFRFWKRVE